MEASALRAPAALGSESGTSPWLRLRTDEQLVNLFRSGSDEAFRIIHDRYRQRLFAYARQMLGGSGTDAEDVLQDVFLRAYRSLRADERPVSLRAWLYRVAHNRCVDHLRRPTPVASEVFEMSRTPAADTMVEAERREDLARLIADVRRLPDQQRSALLMREMDGMSYADLAVALDTSVPAVKSLLVRARIGLVEAIEARDADCADIRHDLAASYDRGVRASGRARRHLRECQSCARYRAQLREVRSGFAAAFSPAPAPVGFLAKLLGLGGAGSGAAAGGAAAGSGATAIGGGAAAAVSVTKVAVVVCCAVAVTGGAEVVQQTIGKRVPAAHHHRTVSPAATTAVAVPTAILHSAPARLLAHRVVARSHGAATVRKVTSPAKTDKPIDNGGVLGPADPGGATPAPAEPTASPTPAEGSSGSLDPNLLPPSDGTTPPLGSGAGSSSSTGTSSNSGATADGSGTTGAGGTSGDGSGSSTGAGTDPPAGSSTSSGSGSSSGSSSGSGSTPPPAFAYH